METFDLIDGVYVTHARCAMPVALTLRQGLLEIANARTAQQGQQSKALQLPDRVAFQTAHCDHDIIYKIDSSFFLSQPSSSSLASTDKLSLKTLSVRDAREIRCMQIQLI